MGTNLLPWWRNTWFWNKSAFQSIISLHSPFYTFLCKVTYKPCRVFVVLISQLMCQRPPNVNQRRKALCACYFSLGVSTPRDTLASTRSLPLSLLSFEQLSSCICCIISLLPQLRAEAHGAWQAGCLKKRLTVPHIVWSVFILHTVYITWCTCTRLYVMMGATRLAVL